MKPPPSDHDSAPPDDDADRDPLSDTVDAPVRQGAAFLSTVRPFKALDQEILGLLHSNMSECAFHQGDFLMRQGDPGNSLIVVADGEVEVSVEESGSVHVLKRAHTGEVLGEMALLTDEPRSASVVAVSPVRAWVLPADRFNEVAAEHPRIGVLLTLLLSSRLGKVQHDALTGKIFSGYRIRRRLGRGGMSVVYEADDTNSGNRVALKMMSHRLLFDPEARKRFQREADIVQSFDHANIARMYGRFEAFRTSFIVMEYCEGISIADALESRRHLTEPVVGQLACALAHAHGAGVIHRDIKPSNVMITRDGAVKLMDFGLAGRIDDGTAAERLLGTPKYMAPEQMTGGPVGTGTDVFAVGLLIYEMLAGERLFQGDDFVSLRKEVIRCRIPALSKTFPSISSELRRVLGQALRRDPEERHLDFERIKPWAGPVDFAALEDSAAHH
jgi:CRP-like cAMP-binding protein